MSRVILLVSSAGFLPAPRCCFQLSSFLSPWATASPSHAPHHKYYCWGWLSFLPSFPVKSNKALGNFQMLLEPSFQVRTHPSSLQPHSVLHLSFCHQRRMPSLTGLLTEWLVHVSMSLPPGEPMLPYLPQSFTHYLAEAGAQETVTELNTCTWNTEGETSGCFPQ